MYAMNEEWGNVLRRAFVPGEWGDLTVALVGAGRLRVSSSRVVACDPFVPQVAEAFERTVPNGNFDVILSIVRFEGGEERVAFAKVVFVEEEPVAWNPASRRACEDTADADASCEEYGEGSAAGCFADPLALTLLSRRYEEDEAYFQVLLDGMCDVYQDCRSWLDHHLAEGHNVVLFSAGYGDRPSASYFGLSTDGEPLCLVTDFRALRSGENEDAPADEGVVVDEEALLEDLATVVRACGAARFFSNPILTPTKACFPDSWIPNETGVRVLAKRLMLYAGLDKLEPEVEVFTDPDALKARRSRENSHHAGAAAYFMGIEGGKALFACESGNLERSEALITVMGHEVAHAFRAYHGIVVADHAHEEELTDITSLFLGFGIFACNASRSYEKTSQGTGVYTTTYEHTSRMGYLLPRALAYLLACQVTARGMGSRAIRRVRAHLNPGHNHYFSESIHDLEKRRGALLDRFGVSEVEADRMAAAAPVKPRLEPIIIPGAKVEARRLAKKKVEPVCPNCGVPIDYKVERCPNCDTQLAVRMHWGCLIVVVIIIVFWAVYAMV